MFVILKLTFVFVFRIQFSVPTLNFDDLSQAVRKIKFKIS